MADRKLAYAASSAATITLAALASDTNLVAGRASTAIDNTSNLYTGYQVAGKVTTGTSPTAARQIEVWAFAQLDDTPTYPDGITGSDANKSMTSADIKAAGLQLIEVIPTDNTSDRTYWFRRSLREVFGGSIPKRFGVFVVHNTGVNLNATAGNHAVWVTPEYETIA